MPGLAALTVPSLVSCLGAQTQAYFYCSDLAGVLRGVTVQVTFSGLEMVFKKMINVEPRGGNIRLVQK